jgi:dipeptidyl aminopeptidase/acylaminoacyl peptidase
LTGGRGHAEFPTFSPDGRTIAFIGQDDDRWDTDTHAFVVPASDGGGAPRRVAPDLDRPISEGPGLPSPITWIGDRDLLMLVEDRGAVALHRARLGQRGSRELIGGDTRIDGVAARPGRRVLAFTASWPDRPSELYASTLGGAEPVQLSSLNTEFLDEVELSPVERCYVTHPDGTEVEYFTIARAARAARGLPVHVDIHGGPHACWPSGRWLAFHQAIAAAGYVVLLPNPRGSTSYGQAFTSACVGDWAGRDCEDILACCDDLVERGIADGARMFVSGGSYGGYMTTWLVGHSDRFRAATAVAAVVDRRSMTLTTEIPDFALFNMGGTPWERPEEYDKRSPLSYLPEVNTPVLVIHWEGDIRVPMSQGEQLYTGLRILGKRAELVRYPGGFHIVRTPSQAVDWVKRMLAWNAEHDASPKRRARRLDSASE